MFQTIKKLFYAAGFYTTLLSMLILIIADGNLPFRMLLCFFLFGMSVSAADLLWEKKSLSFLLQCVIHTAVSLVGFVVFVLLCTGYGGEEGAFKCIAVSLVYLIFHIFCCGVRTLALHHRTRKISEQKEYTPKFQSKEK